MKTLLIGMKSYLVNLLISLVAIGILLPGCASTGGLGGGLGDYSLAQSAITVMQVRHRRPNDG